MRCFIPILLLMLCSANAHADLYKWTDAEGHVHYSDTMPPGETRVQKADIHTTDESSGNASPGKSIFEREADLEKALKAKKQAEQKDAEKEKRAAARKHNCENARSALNSLQNAPRIATYDASGNRTIMDDATRQKRIEQARKAVDQYCN